MFRIAIDTGGTFTDYIAVDDEGRSIITKVPTNRRDPAAGIVEGLHQLAGLCGLELNELMGQTEQLIHGTTLALNALLENKMARTALLTTAGFRDSLEMRRSRRSEQWDLRAPVPRVLVPRYLRFGVTERLDYSGRVITSLDREQLKNIAFELKCQQVEAVAICFLFSFLNPVHEEEAAEILRELLPGIFVTTSSSLAPRIREYERTSTTVLNACLTPVLADYLTSLEAKLALHGWSRPINLMMNSGGLTDSRRIKNAAVKTLLSGPAGGAHGGQLMAQALNKGNLVIADMGGTSFDVNVVVDGGSRLIPEVELAGYPISIPTIDIRSIGAGGGSIASVNPSGRLEVGPHSAGAYPGPACYGRGGTEPTVTDAALLLGLISPGKFLDGKLTLDPGLARQAFESNLCRTLSISVNEAALAVYQIAVANMADAVRLLTVQQGFDPRDFAIVAAGGAFPLFAAVVAGELGIPEVLVPVQGPVFCAWGMLEANCQDEGVKSCLISSENWDIARLMEILKDLNERGDEELDLLGIPLDKRDYELALEMKYTDQHHEISIAIPAADFQNIGLEMLSDAFHKNHEKLYGYAEYGKAWEIVNLRLICREKTNGFSLLTLERGSVPEIIMSRAITYSSTGTVEAKIYKAENLPERINGPALIEFPYTTMLVPEGYSAAPDSRGFVLIRKEEVVS